MLTNLEFNMEVIQALGVLCKQYIFVQNIIKNMDENIYCVGHNFMVNV